MTANSRYESYDLTLAVVASRTLILEARTNEDRARLVWEPTRQFLEGLAQASPTQLTCFSGTSFSFPPDSAGRCVDLYCVATSEQVAYIGTAFTALAEQDDRRNEVARLGRINSAQARILASRSDTAIIRDQRFCKIPLTGESLDEVALTDAVQRYMRTFAPLLADLPVSWLPLDEGSTLHRAIWQTARATAQYASEDSHTRAIMEDEAW